MIEFAVTVQGQRISCTKVKGELVSGAIGAKVRFTWSEEWQQLQRIGVFRAGSVARDVMDLQDECVIPWEVLAQPGQVLMIGVQGVNEEGTAVTPTLEAEMGEILRGADPSDDPSTEPSLPIWQWVKNLLEQVVKKVTKFMGDSDAALDAIIEMQEALLNASGTKPDDYGTPYAVEYIKQKLTEVAKAQARENTGSASATDLQQHIENNSNPHDVTPAQIGAATVEIAQRLTVNGELTAPYMLTGSLDDGGYRQVDNLVFVNLLITLAENWYTAKVPFPEWSYQVLSATTPEGTVIPAYTGSLNDTDGYIIVPVYSPGTQVSITGFYYAR